MTTPARLDPFSIALAKVAEYHPQWAQPLLLLEPTCTDTPNQPPRFDAAGRLHLSLHSDGGRIPVQDILWPVVHVLLGHRAAQTCIPQHQRPAFEALSTMLEIAVVTRIMDTRSTQTHKDMDIPSSLVPLQRTFHEAVAASTTIGGLRGLAASTFAALVRNPDMLQALTAFAPVSLFAGNAPSDYTYTPQLRRSFAQDIDIAFAFDANTPLDAMVALFVDLKTADTPQARIDAADPLFLQATALLQAANTNPYNIAWATLIIEIALVVVLNCAKTISWTIQSPSYKGYAATRAHLGL